MPRFTDLVETIEHETLSRYADLRTILDHPERLERDTTESLAVLGEAMRALDGGYEGSVTATDALVSIAAAYAQVTRSLGQAARRYEVTRNESDYAEGLRLLMLVAESETIPVFSSIKHLNAVYYGVPDLTEYLSIQVELVNESKRVLIHDETPAPITG